MKVVKIILKLCLGMISQCVLYLEYSARIGIAVENINNENLKMSPKVYKHKLYRCLNCPKLRIVCTNATEIPWLAQYNGAVIDFFKCSITQDKISTADFDSFPANCPLHEWDETAERTYTMKELEQYCSSGRCHDSCEYTASDGCAFDDFLKWIVDRDKYVQEKESS